tara:strand:+ start:51 stop:236 length:186 start_codon:yes stop_codon:yes gene_type:complete
LIEGDLEMPIVIRPAKPAKRKPTGMADRKKKMRGGGKVATKKMRGGGKMKVAAKRKGGRLY